MTRPIVGGLPAGVAPAPLLKLVAPRAVRSSASGAVRSETFSVDVTLLHPLAVRGGSPTGLSIARPLDRSVPRFLPKRWTEIDMPAQSFIERLCKDGTLLNPVLGKSPARVMEAGGWLGLRRAVHAEFTGLLNVASAWDATGRGADDPNLTFFPAVLRLSRIFRPTLRDANGRDAICRMLANTHNERTDCLDNLLYAALPTIDAMGHAFLERRWAYYPKRPAASMLQASWGPSLQRYLQG